MKERWDALIAAVAKPDSDYVARMIAKLIVDNRLQADAIIRLQDRVGALEKRLNEQTPPA